MSVFVNFILIALDILVVGLKYDTMNFVEFSVAFIVPVLLMSTYVAYGAKQDNIDIIKQQ
ncbi:hypothetical protein [Acetobacter cibinongensis]|uniref:Uncharacterized protein n=1 Tax=Acetobacter cibinongensis TaxID=146475 RepID=A0A1Z5YXS4_9PROT|nr:hypothetical protein [Acetobacter cibinongensis]OUJ04067.1 hypothetical protein HK14_13245 [Acetobacter cibinongensis]GAN60425.1 hypothetical protein Abci_011_155 [Acetobacter cibinongensis]GBQ18577.1 hypothetical protein AA0482_2287 [Acetobacter cibinongensis NRIC 0482]GEL58129.1 hypothetical protein ACI01nite_07310 [Acetobacter cibinongensis]